MIIVEGGDLVGKTTFAKKVAKHLDLTYQHLSRLPDSFHRVHGYVSLMSPFVVRDRFHLSEIVYAKVRGEETPLRDEWYRVVDAHARLMGTVNVVIIVDDPTMLEDRFVQKREMYTLDQVIKANTYYINEIIHGKRDIDIVITCRKEHPFPSEEDLHVVADLYRSRGEQIERIQELRL